MSLNLVPNVVDWLTVQNWHRMLIIHSCLLKGLVVQEKSTGIKFVCPSSCAALLPPWATSKEQSQPSGVPWVSPHLVLLKVPPGKTNTKLFLASGLFTVLILRIPSEVQREFGWKETFSAILSALIESFTWLKFLFIELDWELGLFV